MTHLSVGSELLLLLFLLLLLLVMIESYLLLGCHLIVQIYQMFTSRSSTLKKDMFYCVSLDNGKHIVSLRNKSMLYRMLLDNIKNTWVWDRYLFPNYSLVLLFCYFHIQFICPLDVTLIYTLTTNVWYQQASRLYKNIQISVTII